MIRLIEVLLPVIIVLIVAIAGLRAMGTGARRKDVARLKRELSSATELLEDIRRDALAYQAGDSVANQQFADVVINRIVTHNRKELAR